MFSNSGFKSQTANIEKPNSLNNSTEINNFIANSEKKDNYNAENAKKQQVNLVQSNVDEYIPKMYTSKDVLLNVNADPDLISL